MVDKKREHVREEDLLGTRAAYQAAIAYEDHEINRLLRQLERRGVLDRTVVVITADHGELFGEHGLQQTATVSTCRCSTCR